jgi:hypothetical protein
MTALAYELELRPASLEPRRGMESSESRPECRNSNTHPLSPAKLSIDVRAAIEHVDSHRNGRIPGSRRSPWLIGRTKVNSPCSARLKLRRAPRAHCINISTQWHLPLIPQSNRKWSGEKWKKHWNSKLSRFGSSSPDGCGQRPSTLWRKGRRYHSRSIHGDREARRLIVGGRLIWVRNAHVTSCLHCTGGRCPPRSSP